MLPPKTWEGVFVLINVALVNDPCWFTVYKGTPLWGEGGGDLSEMVPGRVVGIRWRCLGARLR